MIRGMSCQIVAACAALGTSLVSVAGAGPITPPGGPVEGTYKTLDEVEPRIMINDENTPGDADSRFKITTRGSYYLTSDLPIIGVRNGIKIAADDVTIDLMGFTLYSSDPLPIGSPPVSLNGISTATTVENLCVKNGVVRGFGGIGIFALALNSRFENIRLYENVDGGFYGVTGVVITGCVAQENGSHGFTFSSGCTVENCSATFNDGYGFTTADGNSITGCTAANNANSGMHLGWGCVVANSTATANLDGISVGHGSIVSICTAMANDDGIVCRPAPGGSKRATRVTGCIVSGNDYGIRVADMCVVADNNCDLSGTAGIIAEGDWNRIESNHVTGGATGLQISGQHNMIIGNTAAGNTNNYSIVASNRYGPIIDLTAPGTLPVSGNSAAGTTGTTDPWANFSH